MKKYAILYILSIVAIAIIFGVMYKVREGLSPGSSPGSSPGNYVAPVDPGTDAVSSLKRIASAISSAFSPPVLDSPAASANPNYQNVADDTTQKTVFSQDKCGLPPNPVEELPIDKQMKEMIDKHKTTMMTQLDKYIAKLESINSALDNPEKLLALNPNFKTVNSFGLPLAKITYDACGNSILNLTLVQGNQGTPGNQGSQGLPGVDGNATNNGDKGINGTNPFKDLSFKELPKWYVG